MDGMVGMSFDQLLDSANAKNRSRAERFGTNFKPANMAHELEVSVCALEKLVMMCGVWDAFTRSTWMPFKAAPERATCTVIQVVGRGR